MSPKKMPPKKGEEPKALPLIGRFGTSLKIGIVGLPNVGKSTFFNVLTKSQASAENFPFCTIDPNESRVPVPDERFEYLCEYHKPASKVPAFLNVVDIAGLVKGAHAGQGLGNAFLSHISACDAIFHMTRAFEDEDIIHVEGSVDPVRDIEIIHEELRLKDEEFIMPIIDKLEKVADIMCKIKNWVIDEKKHVRFCRDWNEKEIDVLNKHLFLTSKPMIYLVNLSEKDYIRKKNKWLAKIKEWVDKHDPGALVIPFSGGVELKFQDMSDEEKQKYLEENKTQSVLTKIIKSGYAALLLEYFFTAGPDEVRAWTIRLVITDEVFVQDNFNYLLAKIKEWVDKHDPGALVIPFSGGVELKFQDMSDEEKQKYLEENKTQSVLTKIIKSGYAALLLEYFFTAGPDEVRAWTIRKGTKAPQAAGKIHTDFEKGFIMAEVMKFEDFKEGGTENAVKAAGKYRQLGRNYIVEDGDIIFFKFNTPQQPKKK
ncbi:UNVERIFIED_CONTAM: hypothetical protein FKN15_022156 [Acipenser sinensis]